MTALAVHDAAGRFLGTRMVPASYVSKAIQVRALRALRAMRASGSGQSVRYTFQRFTGGGFYLRPDDPSQVKHDPAFVGRAR